jgi:hypothetical protein
MKKWECVQIDHHKNVGPTIEEYEQNGWTFNTYQVSSTPGSGFKSNINHYVLFEKDIKQEIMQ